MTYLLSFNYLDKRQELRVGNDIATYLYIAMKIGNISNMTIKKI